MAARHTDHLALAISLSNAYILSASEAMRRVHVLDVGIGSGRQIIDLIGALSARERDIDDLVIVGIDPHGPSLEAARAHAHAAAERAGIPCQFHAIERHIELVSEAQWGALFDLLDRPIVNASFSLHHVRAQHADDPTDHILARTRALEPSIIVITERHAARARASSDEITGDWTRRLRRARFTPSHLAITLPRHTHDLDVRLHHDHVELSLHDEPVISVLAWEPSVSTPPYSPPHRPDT